MTPVMKTPGVYIVEKNAFPDSVVEVATAVPAFVGYTQIHEEKGRSLKDNPRLVTSMSEFHTFFGFGPEVEYTLSTTKPTVAATDPVLPGPEAPVAKVGTTSYYLSRNSERFHLYYSMLLFYQNGGGRCYVVSVGDYGAACARAGRARMGRPGGRRPGGRLGPGGRRATGGRRRPGAGRSCCRLLRTVVSLGRLALPCAAADPDYCTPVQLRLNSRRRRRASGS